MAKYSEHSFYCMKCGKKMMGLPRKDGHNYGKHHRKRLWCPWCKTEVNAVECRNDSEVYDFRIAFEAGEYKEELEESLDYVSKDKNILWS